jgi:hypothetical protein
MGVVALLMFAAPVRGAEALPEDRDVSESRPVPASGRREIDEAKGASLGIRKLTGQHITLFTDLPRDAEVDVLPEVFDQAFGQWCDFFMQSREKLAGWRMRGFLIRDKARFQQSGMVPADLPVFPNGYSRNDELWLNEQPSDYYRRHLFLHEGTHGFMNTVLGGCGPQWYMEGIAELLATHRWRDGRLTLNYLPASRDEVPIWGRIKLIRDAVAQRHAMTFPDVIDIGPQAHRAVEAYAWCWAATMLLDRHPRYHERFRQLGRMVLEDEFNEQFRRMYASEWRELCEEWQVMVVDLQYGHDLEHTAIEFLAGSPLASEGANVDVAADRGWQSSRIQLQAGQTYRLKASGRFQLAIDGELRWCEANGVSIHYHQGRPLGVLLAAVRPAEATSGASAFIRPMVVGLEGEVRPTRNGTLYLKINASPATVGKNAGKASVEVKEGRG